MTPPVLAPPTKRRWEVVTPRGQAVRPSVGCAARTELRYVNATIRSMAFVASRELRNDTAAVVRRAAAGEEIVITVNGRPAAQLVALTDRRRRWVPAQEMAHRLRSAQADPGMRDDLASLAGDTTDDLDPLC